jgi:hypothetical protein
MKNTYKLIAVIGWGALCLALVLAITHVETRTEPKLIGMGMYSHSDGEYTVYTYDDWDQECRWKEGMVEPVCVEVGE